MEAYVAALNEKKGISKVSSLDSDLSSALSPLQREFLEKQKGNKENTVESILERNRERLRGFERYEQHGGYEMDEEYYREMSATLRGSQPWVKSVESRMANPLPSAESLLEEQIRTSEKFLAEAQDSKAGYSAEEIEKHKALLKEFSAKLSKTHEEAFLEVSEAFKDWHTKDETEDLMKEELTNAHLYPELYSQVNRDALKAYGLIEDLEKTMQKQFYYSKVESSTGAQIFEHTFIKDVYRIKPDGKAYVDSAFDGELEIKTQTGPDGYLTLSIEGPSGKEVSQKTFIEGPAFEKAFSEGGGLSEEDKTRVIAPYAARLLKRYERQIASRKMHEMLESVRSDAKKYYGSILKDFTEDYEKKSKKQLMKNKDLVENATEDLAKDLEIAEKEGHVAALSMYAQRIFKQRKHLHKESMKRWENRNSLFRRAFPSKEDPRPSYQSYHSEDSKRFREKLESLKREAAVETERQFLETIGEKSFASYYGKHYKTFAKNNPLAIETSKEIAEAERRSYLYLRGKRGVIPEGREGVLVFEGRD